MKRLFNSYLLLTKVKKNGIKEDRDKLLLFAILCMQTAYGAEPIYEYITENRTQIKLDSFITLISGNIDEIDEWSKNNKKLFKDDDQKAKQYEDLSPFWDVLQKTIARDEKITEKDFTEFMRILDISSVTTTSEAGTNSNRNRVPQDIKDKVNALCERLGGNENLMSWAKAHNITWNESENESINNMRLKMALNKAIIENRLSDDDLR